MLDLLSLGIVAGVTSFKALKDWLLDWPNAPFYVNSRQIVCEVS